MAAKEIQSGSTVTFLIKVAGKPIPDATRILSVDIEKRVNRITNAKIVILDGEANAGQFEASSSDTFVPGAAISIEAGYDNENKIIFEGIITGQTIRIDNATGAALEVVCRDAAIKMTVGRKSLTYTNKTDSEIIASIIATYAGLSANVAATATAWPGQVQYDVTDWDYILALATANGLIVTTINGVVTVATPANNTNPICSVIYGSTLMEFNASLNAVNQVSQVNASAWDYKNQQLNSGRAIPDVEGPGNLSAKKLSGVIGLTSYNLQTTAPLDAAVLENWSKAQIIKSEFSKITGEAKFMGTNLVEPANYITMAGIGDRFNGDHFISGVSHTIAEGNWYTTVALGISQDGFMQQADVMSPPASGLLPAARGLLNGIVIKTFDDPESQYRVLVDIPMFDNNGAGIWARLSNFYATNNAGVFFLPEVGDEVVVGFLNEDPRYPVILGSMYSSAKLKPQQSLVPGAANQLKAIVSRSGISIQFDDVNKTLTICTPAINTMVFSDKDKQVTVNDENGNSLVMSADGISIKSAKDINIQSGQKINLQGTQGVNIQSAGGDIEVSGINIQESAQVAYNAHAGATAKITSGAELTLQSAMIMIN
ncbi:type VI secretion system tip protein VgrG [Ferruginibacter sp. SUN106]|uniref:type VI secretion system tip protein VgrG n=1 Tax=Ferruginibacter sp. SUN106 TaxID=2978348 RepID=UPI003D3681C4